MRKERLYGVLASTAMLVFYFAVLTISENFAHAVSQFWTMWYWIIALSAGFGFQVGLFVYMKEHGKNTSNREVIAAGGMSTGSMIACCAHHLSDLVAVLGLSGAFIFFADYQMLFIYAGVLSNLLGISIMLGAMQDMRLWNSNLDMRQARNAVIMASFVILPVAFLNMDVSQIPSVSATLSTLSDTQNRVTVEVTPEISDNSVSFDVSLNTHSVDLNFDLAEVSYLEAGGKIYYPSLWEGSPPGGHHRSGTLYFDNVNSKEFSLTIKNVGGIDRVFIWG
jgi:hypothetical protein